MSDESNTVVTCFGLHETSEGVKFLHQGNKKSYNFIGLRQPSPFKVEIKAGAKRSACPHLINANSPMPDRVHWDLFLKIYSDEFARKFLPIPRHRSELVPFLPDPNNDKHMLLLLLSKFSSPIYPVIKRFDSISIQYLEEDLNISNLTPLVLTDIETKDQLMMEQAAHIARRSPRRLILVGDPRMVIRDPIARYVTYVDGLDQDELFSLPMEHLGAVALRRYCRGEAIDSPWVRREE